ncbi:hypothetical protein HZS_1865 [Henneguya salminicola]|nr:hypothetical protein HZS_1865 [Henneguya salminicola]
METTNNHDDTKRFPCIIKHGYAPQIIVYSFFSIFETTFFFRNEDACQLGFGNILFLACLV